MKKGLYIFVTCMMIGFFLSCSKDDDDVAPTMEAYYAESVNLNTASTDSVKSFKSKVANFIATYPEAKYNQRYSQIKENIKAASLRLNITINDEWAGEEFYNY